MASAVGVFILVAALAVGAFFGWRLFAGSNVRLPDSMAGVSRLEIPEVERQIDVFREMMEDLGFEGDAAMYGTGGVPSFLVMVINDSPGEAMSQDAMFDQFAAGFSSGSGLQIDRASLDLTQEGDVTLRCTRVTGGPQASMCMWVDPETVGVVFTFLQGVDPTRDLTRTVRSSVGI